jgi:CheY-like chemotaxis protein
MDKRVFSVLVIDDEPAVLRSIQLLLRASGLKLSLTTDPKKGLEMARTIEPDVIVCDAAMPDLSGSQVITMLKEDAVTARIPAVLMTAVAEAHMFSHVPWTGFLSKPFSAKELREAIVSAAKTAVPKNDEQVA